jgi:hypothetical protein
MKKQPYNKAYYPSAPVLPVRLASLLNKKHLALVDSGADGTFIPTDLLSVLDIQPLYTTNVRSHFSEILQRVPVYQVDLIFFDSIHLPAVEVVGDDWGKQIILGRNVLNKLDLRLNGPAQTTLVEE